MLVVAIVWGVLHTDKNKMMKAMMKAMMKVMKVFT